MCTLARPVRVAAICAWKSATALSMRVFSLANSSFSPGTLAIAMARLSLLRETGDYKRVFRPRLGCRLTTEDRRLVLEVAFRDLEVAQAFGAPHAADGAAVVDDEGNALARQRIHHLLVRGVVGAVVAFGPHQQVVERDMVALQPFHRLARVVRRPSAQD